MTPDHLFTISEQKAIEMRRENIFQGEFREYFASSESFEDLVLNLQNDIEAILETYANNKKR